MICEYGCGQEAKYYFPTVKKWCCSTHTSKCPERIKKWSGKNNPMYGKTPWNKDKTGVYSVETLKKIRQPRHTKGKTYEEIYGKEKAIELKKLRSKHFSKIRKGKTPWNKDKTGIYSDETLKKISESRTYTIEDYKNKHPYFYKIEKPIIVNGDLLVRCKYCNKRFIPTRVQLTERIRCLKNNTYKSYFYCSDICKGKCDKFDRKVDPDQLEKFKQYSSLVYRETRKTLQKYNIKNINLRGIKYGYELDHKYSIYHGFLNNIKPKIIANRKNLKIIPMKENRKKKFNSSITLETLLSY